MDNDSTAENISEQFKNKSTLKDGLLGKVRTEEFDDYYENIQTKVSNRLSDHKTIFKLTKKIYSLYASVFGPFHMLPDFIVLGPGRCGTTSMVELYLRSNPDILPSKNKEIFYFDINFKKPLNWYKLFFPSVLTKFFRSLKGKKTLIVVTHRLSTVKNCDKIFFIEKGKITKEGSPKEILNNIL